MLQNGIKVIKTFSWTETNYGYYQKTTKILFYGNPADFYNSIVKSISNIQGCAKDVVEEKFLPRKRNKGENSADYVASMAGLNSNAKTSSHYTPYTIPITLPDGTKTPKQALWADPKK